MNAFGQLNDQGALNAGTSNKGYRVSASIVDQFMDDTVGVAFGYSRIDQPRQATLFNAWGYGGAPALGAASGGEPIIGGMKPYVQSETLVRDGFFGTLQWQPSDRFETQLDLFYTDYSEERLRRGIEFPLGFTAFGVTVDDVAAVNGDGFVTAGTFGNVRGVVRNDLELREADLFAAGWNANYQATERLKLTVDVGYSTVNREDTILETYTGTGSGETNGAADTLSFITDATGTRFTSNVLDYSDPTLIGITAPLGWGGDRFDQNGVQVAQGGQTGFLNRPSVEEDLLQIRGWAEYELDGPISKATVGVNYTDRSKERFADEFFIDLAGFQTFVQVPQNLLLEPTNLDFLGLGGMISYDPLALIAQPEILQTRNFNADVLTKAWVVDEKVTTGFVRFDMDGSFGAIPVRGNFGVQVVHTDQSSEGAAASGNAPNVSIAATSDGDTYTEFYPSLNLSMEFVPDQFVRIGLARVATRPRMDQMSAAVQISYNQNCEAGAGGSLDCTPTESTLFNSTSYYQASGGNPRLRPTITNNFDLSYENYFSDGGYFSIAAFYKLFESYVPTISLPIGVRDFAGFPTQNPGDVPVSTIGIVRGVESVSDGGYIRGIEVSAAIPFVDFSQNLDGFGLLGSFSYTGSSVEIIPGVDIPVPGLSERVGNVTLYWEPSYTGLSARVSARHRSEFLGEVAGFGAVGQFVIVEGETILDAQVAYEFDEDGPMGGLRLIGQVENLTNEEFVTLNGPGELFIRDFNTFGRTFMLGASYRF